LLRGAFLHELTVRRVSRVPRLSVHTSAARRPEAELLLCCARTHVDAARVEQMKTLLQEDINWQQLIQMAKQQGVTPLLYRSLSASCPEAVPKVIMDQLQRYFHMNALRNRFLSKELLKILTLFETHGLPALPYKGPVLAATAYGDLALRQFGDLDLLIHKKNFQKAKELLISQGYRSKLPNSREAAYLEAQYHLEFVRADGRVTIELHWEVAWRYWFFPLEFDRLWARAVPVSFAGGTISNLLPEDSLLILCVHGGKHQWERLMWICDVAEFILAHQMDWRRLLAQAQTEGSKRTLLVGLFLANDLLGADLAEEVRQSIQADPKVKFLAKQVSEQLFVGPQSLSEDDTRPAFYRTVFYMRVRERLWDKAQFFVHYPFLRYLHLLPQRLRNLLKHPRGF